ncbi:RagB/SusD family nutrient uptake outer membrane protein [Halalkalibaculum sp. DA384]
MKGLNIILAILLVFAFGISCEDFTSYQPKGVVSEADLQGPESVEGLVNAAYAGMANDHWVAPFTNNWPWGSVRSDNSYKGGAGPADQSGYHNYEIFSTIRPDQSKADGVWFNIYRMIQRANEAMNAVKGIDEGSYPNKTERLAEMHFIRAHGHFLLKRMFKRVPYIHEDIPSDSLKFVSNVEYTSQELWDKIAEDFQFAVDNLPQTQEDVGRPNKPVAQAYLAKLRLYQAYEKDEQHQVTNINQDRLQEVVDLTNEVINSGQYSLFDDIAQNFLWEWENGEEILFSIQRSKDDGTPIGRIDMANALNWTMNPEFGCCWFHLPSFNLVNSFRTNADGIPMFDSFNDEVMVDSADFHENTFDPRLDHTVHVPKHIFKYQSDVIYDSSYTRAPQVYGPFSTMKEIQQLDCPCLAVPKGYAYPTSTKNNTIIRYADVLLWKAEALIQLGRQGEALPIINDIRERANNSRDRLRYENGDYVSNYNIEPYVDGVNINWTQENAMKALQWERRLEFAMEGVRFFDLVRWGIAAETLNNYFDVEKERVPILQTAQFTEGRDEYLPIPQQQIDFSEGTYEQNTGW